MTAVQSFSKPDEVESTTGVMLMVNALSGAYFVTAAQSLFSNRLVEELATSPNVDTAKALATGATQIREVFSGVDLETVVRVYMIEIKDVFLFSLAGAAFTVPLALLIPFKKLEH